MISDGEKLYIARKIGFGMSLRYKLSVITPFLLIIIITAILVFSLVFISSMSSSIERMIVLLGSGSLSSDVYVSPELLPPSSSVDGVKYGEGIFYSENGESIGYIKGVDESYFSPERLDGLNGDIDSLDGNWVVLSENLAKSLSVSKGDKMTLLIYEEGKNRTRPYLVRVEGIFSSGYAQLDRYMAFSSKTLIPGEESYEILLAKDVDVESVQNDLKANDIYCRNYKENNVLLYSNVQQSIWILYVIVALIAFLSAFFSLDVSQVFLSRDREDIAMLKLLGMKGRNIRRVYVTLIMILLVFSIFIGLSTGLILSIFSPNIVEFVSARDPELLEYYITSFSLDIPVLEIFIMIILMVLCAYISLEITLFKREREELLSLVNNE